MTATSVQLSGIKLSTLYNHHHYLFPEAFNHAKQTLYPFNNNSPFPLSSSSLVTSISVSMNLPILGTLHKWNPVFVHLFLAYFTIVLPWTLCVIACVRISFLSKAAS